MMLPKASASGFYGCLLAILLAAAMPSSAHAQTVSTLYSFTDGADGAQPIGGVVQDKAGVLYGETSIGGASGCTSKAGQPKGGCGTVYSFSPTQGLKTLVSFIGANGAYGQNTMTLVGSTLYGTTVNGGSADDGIVFSVKTDGTGFTVLHQFSGTDGRSPTSILRPGSGGILYGISLFGGTHGAGVLFSIKPDGTFAILHNFVGGTKDGEEPTTLLMSGSNTLVGSSLQGGAQKVFCAPGGCGTIFEFVISSGAYTVPYKFDGLTGLGGYIGDIGPGPTVYGNDGTAPFSLSLSTGLVNIGTFYDSDVGAYQSGPLRRSDGSLIGVEGAGPISAGVIYTASNGVTTALNALSDPLAQPFFCHQGLSSERKRPVVCARTVALSGNTRLERRSRLVRPRDRSVRNLDFRAV